MRTTGRRASGPAPTGSAGPSRPRRRRPRPETGFWEQLAWLVLIVGATLALAFLFDTADPVDGFVVFVAVWVLLAYAEAVVLHATRLRSVTGLVLATAGLVAADAAYRPSVIGGNDSAATIYLALPAVELVAVPALYLLGRAIGRAVTRSRAATPASDTSPPASR